MIRYTKKEEIWNASSHGGGILLGVVFGIIFLVWCFRADNNWARVGVILYLFGMLGSYAASTIYHSMKHHSKWKERLRKWDHAAIYWPKLQATCEKAPNAVKFDISPIVDGRATIKATYNGKEKIFLIN